jgi:ATP-dependent DNA helicase RecG
MNKDELQLIIEEGEGYRIEFKESKAGLPPIKFEFDNFFTATFQRPIREEISFFTENDKLLKTIDDTINDTINEPINEVVKKRLIKEILYIAKYGFITRAVIESISKISIATAKRDAFLLKKMGFIKFKGARKTGKYILSDKGKKILDSILS